MYYWCTKILSGLCTNNNNNKKEVYKICPNKISTMIFKSPHPFISNNLKKQGKSSDQYMYVCCDLFIFFQVWTLL